MTAKPTPEETAHETGYAEGRRATLSRLLMHFAGEFYATQTDPLTPESRLCALEAERLDAVNALRDLCTELGCNDWPDNLHLRDIIEKHLGRHLRRTVRIFAAKDLDDAIQAFMRGESVVHLPPK